MRKPACVAALTSVCVLAAAPASAATLVHAYDFANAGAATAVDLVGSVNGTLVGGAVIAGGVLVLDGVNSAVTFGQQLIPFAGEFSVFVRTTLPSQGRNFSEIIAQGQSGGPGFYIGSAGNGFRLGDLPTAPAVSFHVDDAFHNLLFTNGAGGLSFSIDGAAPVYTAGPVSFGGACNTVIGDQFCGGFNEYFNGEIDTVKIYSGVATYAEATSATAGAVPEPSAWALMILGFGGAGAMLRRGRGRGHGAGTRSPRSMFAYSGYRLSQWIAGR